MSTVPLSCSAPFIKGSRIRIRACWANGIYANLYRMTYERLEETGKVEEEVSGG
jgi:hypothetical protein